MVYKIYDAITAPPRLPEDLPWVGRPKGLFSETRARLGSLGDFRWQISEVHEKVILKPQLLKGTGRPLTYMI